MNDKRQSVSLVIPAYNEERHLKACLDAVAAQTVMPTEVIVVDNNSTDRTAAIALSYPFVTLLHEHQQGIVYTRNAGFNAAHGQIIGRIDADTILPPYWTEYVQNFYADHRHRNLAWTGGGYFYNVRWPRINGWVLGQIAFRFNRFLMGHYIVWGSNMAFLREQWEKIKSEVCDRTDIHEDLDLAIHLHQAGVGITYQAGVFVGVEMRRVHGTGNELWANLYLWPQTLRVHHNPRWLGGMVGTVLLFCTSPGVRFVEWLAQASTDRIID